MKNSQMKRISVIAGEEITSKFDEVFPIDNELEISKELVAEALIPIMDCIRDDAKTVKKKKCYELVNTFLEDHHDEIVDKMYDVFKQHEKGATMIVKVAVNPNPYLPYRITKVFIVSNDERNTFEIQVVDNKKLDTISFGSYTWLCSTVDGFEIERKMSYLEQSCEKMNVEENSFIRL